jgi:uncharacterized protein (DUF1697 family)
MPRPARTPDCFVALIRGINVGTAKRVSMADLKTAVERLGYGDVRTVLNSGNVVFRGANGAHAARRIERAMETKVGVPARVVVLETREVEAIVAENPLVERATNFSRLMVAVPIDGDVSILEPLLDEDWSPDVLALGRRAAYVWHPEGILESRLAKALLRTHGRALTVRNWATFTKLLGLMHGTGRGD